MTLVRWLVNMVCAVTLSIVFLYFAISLAVLAFIVLGDLHPGQPMYLDAITRELWQVLVFQIFCLSFMALCFFLRTTIGLKNDFTFLRIS